MCHKTPYKSLCGDLNALMQFARQNLERIALMQFALTKHQNVSQILWIPYFHGNRYHLPARINLRQITRHDI